MFLSRIGKPTIATLPLRRITTFGAVSVLSTVIDFALFNVLTLVTPMAAVVANALSYSAGIAASYALNKRFTFKGRGRDDLRMEMIIFLAINVAGLGATTLVLLAVSRAFGDHLLLLNLGKLIAGFFVWGLKYVTFQRWVYPAKPEVSL